jgi:hypothetical protein
MVKKGVYCSINKKHVEDKHGGVTSEDWFYDHLCFYLPEKTVGFYGGSKMWFDPYRNRTFRYNGEIVRVDDREIVFTVNDTGNEDKWLFKGQLVNDLLSITATRKSEPEKIWLEDFFEYIGTGSEEGNSSKE